MNVGIPSCGKPTVRPTEGAEDEGFEPSIGFPIHAFQACALGRYANPPALRREPQRAKGSGVQRRIRHIR